MTIETMNTIPSYEELEQAVERAYQTGLATVSCPPPAESWQPSTSRIKAPKLPSGLGAYSNLLLV